MGVFVIVIVNENNTTEHSDRLIFATIRKSVGLKRVKVSDNFALLLITNLVPSE